MIITIGCEYGSGGSQIGSRVAQLLGIEFYDRDLIDQVVDRLGIERDLVEKADNTDVSYAFETSLGTRYANLSNKVIAAQFDVIQKFAEKSDCVIIGRCSDYILRERTDVLNIFLYAPLETRIHSVMSNQNMTRKNAQKQIEISEEALSARYKYITGTHRGNRHGRHMMLDSSVLGWEKTAKYIVQLADLKFGKK
ncbi:MAG: cytidylate kinase [Epulopiscium sp. Nele67-Bin001]|nr:MAG: cytidylate kinase [Epulopiscium sp. Nuni2H_MBin001]OON92635.1 MAG: cytidylate kinase [Epulopiscium sp. Nele67-Bin001]